MLAAYLVAAVALTSAVWFGHGRGLVGGQPSDVVQATWFLAWVGFACSHLHAPLVTGALSPAGHPISLMWNNAAPLIGVLLAPVTLTLGAGTAYDLGMTAAFALSAWTAAIALGRVTRHSASAFVGGLVFGFSPWSIAQAAAGHLFLVSLWLVPITLAVLAEGLVGDGRRPLRAGAAFGVLAAGQLLVSQEIFADLMLLSALATLAVLVGARHRTGGAGRAVVPAGLTAVVTFAVAAAVPLLVAFHGPSIGIVHGFLNPHQDVADLVGLAVPRPGQLLDPAAASAVTAHLTGWFGEATVYMGVGLLAAVLGTGAQWRREPWARAGLLLFGAATVLSLGPDLHVAGRALPVPLPWILLLHLPVYRLLVPSRIAPFAYLGAGLCAALICDRLRSQRSGLRVPAATAAAVAIVLPLLPAGALPRLVLPIPRYFTGAGVRRLPVGAVVAVLPPPSHLVGFDAMLWQAVAGLRFRSPWGYAIQAGAGGVATAFGGGGALRRDLLAAARGASVSLSPEQRRRLLRTLRQWDVTVVVAGPMPDRAAVQQLVGRLLGSAPLQVDGVDQWRVPVGPRPTAPISTLADSAAPRYARCGIASATRRREPCPARGGGPPSRRPSR